MSTKYESPSRNNLNLERIFRNCFSLSLNGGLVGGNREVLASYPEPSRYQVGTYRRDKSKRTKRWPLWSCYNDRRWRQPCETTTTSVVKACSLHNVAFTNYKRCRLQCRLQALWRQPCESLVTNFDQFYSIVFLLETSYLISLMVIYCSLNF